MSNTNEVQKFDSELLKKYAGVDAEALSTGTSGNVKYVSCQGGVFSIKDEELGSTIVGFPVLKVSTNTFYEGDFDTGNSKAVCGAKALTETGLYPFENAPSKMCGSCVSCPKAQFKKKPDGKWLARPCKNGAQLFVLSVNAIESKTMPQIIEDIAAGEYFVLVFNIPSTSKNDVVKMLSDAVKANANMPMCVLKTEFVLKNDKKTVFRMEARIDDVLQDATAINALMQLRSDLTPNALKSPFVNDDDFENGPDDTDHKQGELPF